MKVLFRWAIFIFAAVFGSTLVLAQDSPRERLLFDFGWKFHLGDDWPEAENLAKAGMSKGAAGRKFDDSKWQTVNLPHDWVVQLPFDKNASYNHGFKPVGPGYPQNSAAWYRRTFDLPSQDAGKRIWIEFDGVFRDAQVFVNGWLIGHHEGGYNGFRYDITDVANCGGTNVVAVRVDATKFEGWFYEGAGIYRHVWLVKTAPLAIAPDGIFVRSQFKDNVPKGRPDIRVQVQLLDTQATDADATVTAQIISPEGQELASVHKEMEIPGGSTTEVDQMTRVSKPELWSPQSPTLYRLVTTVKIGAQVIDREETPFGIRTIGFDPDKGFLLNGEPYEIKGTCNHQDHAGVGSALPDRLQYFRISRLKEMGCNAYRTSHNEPTAELIDACDQLGMLVMDENRLLGSDPENLARFQQQILRDRNHPSVVIWSICNEESRQSYPDGGRVGATMQAFVKQLDPTRPVTCAESVGNVYSGLMSALEVRGWNYHYGPDMEDYHREHPQQPEVGTEQGSTVSTRGIYETDKTRGYVSAYDSNFPHWASTSQGWWSYFADRPWLSGGFYWTGFDYRGEPTPYKWPCINSHFGIMDTCGFPKDNFYYYQSVWSDKPVIHLLPHWNWAGKEGQNIAVWCYANCQDVELFLNGQSQGRKTMPRNGHLEWQVPYAAGTLSAKGYDSSGEVVSATEVDTTGAPSAVELQPDRNTISADGEDISIITVSVRDEPGRVVPAASNLVHFAIQGPGRIIGVGNGDPSCHEPDQYPTQTGWQRSVFNGLAQIIVQSTKVSGEITLTATADGLQPQTIYIQSQACEPRPAVP
ncbi:MAG TPA: beta-galactosidase GalA [Verrucomicrobiae bacterium]|nr:beta-galactosidase GalA [Verrucomicrobiae bacterium]